MMCKEAVVANLRYHLRICQSGLRKTQDETNITRLTGFESYTFQMPNKYTNPLTRSLKIKLYAGEGGNFNNAGNVRIT